jgi:hypothetical protein
VGAQAAVAGLRGWVDEVGGARDGGDEGGRIMLLMAQAPWSAELINVSEVNVVSSPLLSSRVVISQPWLRCCLGVLCL